jgi:hypothetical protein
VDHRLKPTERYFTGALKSLHFSNLFISIKIISTISNFHNPNYVLANIVKSKINILCLVARLAVNCPLRKKLLIFEVISLLVVVLVFSSTTDVLAKPRKPAITCRPIMSFAGNFPKTQCCQDTKITSSITLTYCTTCDNTSPPSNCSDRYCVAGCQYANSLSPSDNKTGQLPLPPNGNLTFSPSNTTNNTTPSSGLLNGRIPTTNTLNAPITTSNGNTSNPSNNNTGSSLNTIRGGGSSATRSLINGNSPAASGPQPTLPYSPTINNTSAAMKATRSLYSPTGGCIPGGSTCIPCDIGLARIGANCIPSGDWHPRNGLPPLSTLQQQQQQQPTTTTLCPDGSQPDANGNCPSSNSLQQIAPPSSEHHHKGSNSLLGGQETSSTTTKKSKNNNNSSSS